MQQKAPRRGASVAAVLSGVVMVSVVPVMVTPAAVPARS